jgi:23S rRNA (guanosine2251-2'-O)-methyltransferase
MSKTPEYVYGLHSARAFLDNSAHQVYVVYMQSDIKNEKVKEIVKTAKQQGISVESLEKSQLDKMTGEANHQGIVIRIKSADLPQEAGLFDLLDSLEHPPFLLLLDEIQDPHNFGACLRTAAAAGVDAVIIPKAHSVQITPTVRKVASGAAEVLSIFAVTNLARTMRELKERGVWLTGAAADAPKSLYEMDFKGPLGIVMGNEGSGLRRLTSEHCDHLVKIPMTHAVASLNVSVATAVFLFEARRQRH